MTNSPQSDVGKEIERLRKRYISAKEAGHLGDAKNVLYELHSL